MMPLLAVLVLGHPIWTLLVAFALLAGMAYTALTPITLKQNNYAVVAGDLTLVWTAGDAANGNTFPFTGNEILLAWNTDSSAHSFSLQSVPDQLGRSDTSLQAYSVPATSIAAIQLNQLPGWNQNGQFVINAVSSALVKFAILRKN